MKDGEKMIQNIEQIADAYLDLFNGKPIWFTVTYITLNIIFLIICYKFEKDGLPKQNQQKFAALINYAVWFLVILIFPLFGMLGYIVCTIVPFVIWKKDALDGERFVWAFQLKNNQLKLLIIFGILGKVAETLFKDPLQGIEQLDFLVAFFAFILIVVFDAISDFSKRRVYVALETENPYRANKGMLLGKKYKSVDVVENHKKRIRAEGAAARIAADKYFDQYVRWSRKSRTYFDEEVINSYEFKFTYSYLPYQESNLLDVVEAKWLLLQGVTRLIVLDNTDDGFIEHVVYAALPRVPFMFIRALILFFVLIALFTPAFVELHLGVVGFWTNLF